MSFTAVPWPFTQRTTRDVVPLPQPYVESHGIHGCVAQAYTRAGQAKRLQALEVSGMGKPALMHCTLVVCFTPFMHVGGLLVASPSDASVPL